jgi:hypothetical protein
LTLSLVGPILVEVALSFVAESFVQRTFRLRYPMQEPIFRRLRGRLPTLRLLAHGPKIYQIAHLASG